MALILKCDICGKKMGFLEESVIKGDQYLCTQCGGGGAKSEEKPDNTNTSDIPDFGLYGDALVQATYWKNPQFTVFVNCNYKYVGTTSYDMFHTGRITVDPYATPDQIVDVFRNANEFILANHNSWDIYQGFSMIPTHTYYHFDKELIERALSQGGTNQVPNPIPVIYVP